MATIVFRNRLFRSDWWQFGLLAVAAAIACTGLGWAMRRDERAAERSRAEHVARSLAQDLARMAVTPGSDFAGTLPGLAQAAGSEVRLAVVDAGSDPDFEHLEKARYLGHSDAGRAGGELDAARADDRRVFALVQRAHRPGLRTEPMLFWSEGRVNATVLGPAGSGAAAVVENLAPPSPSPRPLLVALAAFAMIALAAAGLNDLLPRAGPVLNGLLLGVGVAVVALLGRALEPSLWRGVPTNTLVRHAEGLKLVELARTLAQDLPAPASRVETVGLAVAALGCAFYVLALGGLWHRLGRAVHRDRTAWRFAGPAVGVGLGVVLLPLLAGVLLAFLRATPADVAWAGGANFAPLAGPGSLESPLGLWQPLFWTVLVAATSAALQVAGGRAVAALLRAAGPGPVWRTLLLVPWALPAFAAVLVVRVSSQELFGLLTAGGPLAPVGLALAVSVWAGLPVAALLVERAWRAVPAELEDAARLEGLSRRQRRRLLAPMLRPGVRAATWVAVMLALGLATLAQLLTPGAAGDGDLLATRGGRWALERFEYGQSAAFAIPAFGLVLLVTLVLAGRARALE